MVEDLIKYGEEKCKTIFKKIDENEEYFSRLVLEAFQEENILESDFAGTTGYGYADIGRDKIERVFARVLKGEKALVRNQFISGTHALSTAFFALLRPNDTLLSITGLPYDTIHKVIGIKDNPSSLKSFGINYKQIDLIDNKFDTKGIIDVVKNDNIKVITIQRSMGYSKRKSILIEDIKNIINEIRKVNKDVIIMVDNCYCEFVERTSPLEVGANIIVGSLIKNLGGSIASNGAYICGDEKLVLLCSERLNMPGEGVLVGPSGGANKMFLQGLFFAPSVVSSALKIATLTSFVLNELEYEVFPKYDENRADIVLAIVFNNRDKLINYIQSIQANSPIDSNFEPIPSAISGYDDEIIMASGSFTQGSSIELSCDGPLRSPYIAYQQGGVTYSYGKIALKNILEKLMG